jgi:hypothetical protein
MVQVVAWTKMFTGYAQTMTVHEALIVTFDGSASCELCGSVSEAREVARKQAVQSAQSAAAKIVLACDETAVAVTPPVAPADWPRPLFALPTPRCEPVPVPPPRA